MGTVGKLSLGAFLATLVFFPFAWKGKEMNDRRCEAARQTIVEEAELIQGLNKYPGEGVTDRWRNLMGGCV